MHPKQKENQESVPSPFTNIVDDILRSVGQQVEPHIYGPFKALLSKTFSDEVPDRIKNMSLEEALQELYEWDKYRDFTAAKRLTFKDSVTYLQIEWRLEQIRGTDATGKPLTADEIDQRYEEKLDVLKREFKLLEPTITQTLETQEDVGPSPY
jgi:hypothetical protein